MSNLSRLDHHNWRKCSSKVCDWSKSTTTRHRQRRGCFIAWYYLAMDCYIVSKIRHILWSLWLSITSSIFWLDNKKSDHVSPGRWNRPTAPANGVNGERTRTGYEPGSLSLDWRYFGDDPLLRFILSFLTRQQKTQPQYAIRSGKDEGPRWITMYEIETSLSRSEAKPKTEIREVTIIFRNRVLLSWHASLDEYKNIIVTRFFSIILRPVLYKGLSVMCRPLTHANFRRCYYPFVGGPVVKRTII